jgi:hypothetical protein
MFDLLVGETTRQLAVKQKTVQCMGLTPEGFYNEYHSINNEI